jgi:uncharacterized protein YutE (UPF0331/DUF86 family)
MGIKEEVTRRFEVLIGKGRQLLGTLGPEVVAIRANGSIKENPEGFQYWVPKVKVPEFRAWLTSASNLIHFIVPPETTLANECDKIMSDDHLKQGVPSNVVVLMLGLLIGARDDWQCGFLDKMEYIVSGATFDDFLDHAEEYHKGNKKNESSVLASAVLEDTVKKIAQKNKLATENKTLDPLIDELVKANIFTPVKAKRVKSFAGVRNHALHAEWDKFDNSDVGAMIIGIRELIEELL